jgi:hypothetical protein
MPEIPSDHWLLNPNASEQSNDTEDPVLVLLPPLAEADALAKEGDNDASDRFIDIQGELARVTATSLPGLCAHLEQFQPFVEDFGVGAGHVAAKHAAAIEKGLAEGVTAATLPGLQEHLEQLGELVEGFVDSGACGNWYDSIVEGFETLVESRFDQSNRGDAELAVAPSRIVPRSNPAIDNELIALFCTWVRAARRSVPETGDTEIDDRETEAYT